MANNAVAVKQENPIASEMASTVESPLHLVEKSLDEGGAESLERVTKQAEKEAMGTVTHLNEFRQRVTVGDPLPPEAQNQLEQGTAAMQTEVTNAVGTLKQELAAIQAKLAAELESFLAKKEQAATEQKPVVFEPVAEKVLPAETPAAEQVPEVKAVAVEAQAAIPAPVVEAAAPVVEAKEEIPAPAEPKPEIKSEPADDAVFLEKLRARQAAKNPGVELKPTEKAQEAPVATEPSEASAATKDAELEARIVKAREAIKEISENIQAESREEEALEKELAEKQVQSAEAMAAVNAAGEAALAEFEKEEEHPTPEPEEVLEAVPLTEDWSAYAQNWFNEQKLAEESLKKYAKNPEGLRDIEKSHKEYLERYATMAELEGKIGRTEAQKNEAEEKLISLEQLGKEFREAEKKIEEQEKQAAEQIKIANAKLQELIALERKAEKKEPLTKEEQKTLELVKKNEGVMYQQFLADEQHWTKELKRLGKNRARIRETIASNSEMVASLDHDLDDYDVRLATLEPLVEEARKDELEARNAYNAQLEALKQPQQVKQAA